MDTEQPKTEIGHLALTSSGSASDVKAVPHTPGPWWVTDSGVRDRGGYICHTNKAQRYEGQEDRYQRETAERAANALLIAAGPEMLEALRPFANYACDEPCDCHNCRARAVIAKAEGRAS